MSNAISGTTHNHNTGMYEVSRTNADGETTTQSYTYATLCMMFSLASLDAQEDVFALQMTKAQTQVDTLTMINDCMAMLSSYTSDIKDEGDAYLNGVVCRKDDDGDVVYGEEDDITSDCKTLEFKRTNDESCTIYYKPGSDADKWLNEYRPALIETGLVVDGPEGKETGLGLDCRVTEDEFSSLMENFQTAQATASSQNEQQMLITNDAASKRSSILQLAQSLMQQAAEGRKAAVQS